MSISQHGVSARPPARLLSHARCPTSDSIERAERANASLRVQFQRLTEGRATPHGLGGLYSRSFAMSQAEPNSRAFSFIGVTASMS